MTQNKMPRLVFWLPVVVIAIAVFDNAARLEYAATAIGMDREYRNEVEFATESNSSKQLTYLSFAAVGAFALVRRSKTGAREIAAWPIVLPAVLVLVYMFCSFWWSDAPFTTIKRTILAACIAIGSWGLGKAWSLKEFCLAIVCLSGTFLLVGIMAEIYYGTFLGVGGDADYRFSGVLHPARQAFSCSMMALACFALYRSENRSIFLALAAAAIVFTLMTKARTGTAALLIAACWFWGRQLSVRKVASIIWIGLFAVSALTIYSGAIGGEVDIESISRMGRQAELADPTKFTGRLPIWSSALGFFREQPMIGYGYGAFWIPERILLFERQNGWTFTHAHSAYIESLVNLGVIGFGLGMITIAATFARCSKLGSQHQIARSLVTSLLLFGLISGVAESAFINDGYELIIAIISISYIAHRHMKSEEVNAP